MKRRILTMAICLGVIASSSLYARGGWKQYNRITPTNTYVASSDTASTASDVSVAGLTQEQIDDLVYMYQEEKVARDVYIALGDRWGLNVFSNIQRAEQTHMDAIKTLLNNYGIPVPVANDTEGVFDNQDLQALYDDLLEKGYTSARDALEVGVLVEETDIADLEAKIINAPSDVAATFDRLLRGSYNHLRAFNRQL